MNDIITLITCTGNRPEAFALCEQFMGRQTYRGKIQWIVVDDGTPATRVSKIAEYYKGPRVWEEGLNTHRFNMELAITKVKGDKILIIEDDDYYASNYVETMVKLLETVPLVGEANAKYYKFGKFPGYKEMHNSMHASLCQTGLRREVMSLLTFAINSGDKYFDIELWRKALLTRVPNLLFNNLNLCVGMKGMPGRTGVGVGHTQNDYRIDTQYARLKEWIGEDYKLYEALNKRTNEKESASRIQSSSKEDNGRGLRSQASGSNTSIQDKKSIPISQKEKPKTQQSQRNDEKSIKV